MRGRLALLVAATTSVVLLAFLLPLAVLISRAATNNAVTDATRVSQSLASTVTVGTAAEIQRAIDLVKRNGYPAAVRLHDRRLGDATADQAGSRSGSTAWLRRPARAGTLARSLDAADRHARLVSSRPVAVDCGGLHALHPRPG